MTGLVLKLDIATQPSVSANWTTVKCPVPEYHQQQTRPCGIRLCTSIVQEETLYTVPDSTTGPEEVQESDDEGIT